MSIKKVSVPVFTVGQLFSDKTFFVPAFQREYRWGESELRTFYGVLKDLVDERLVEASDAQIRMGTIVLLNQKDRCRMLTGATLDIFGIVDGQQRVTTIMLYFLAVHYKALEILPGLIAANQDGKYVTEISRLQWMTTLGFERFIVARLDTGASCTKMRSLPATETAISGLIGSRTYVMPDAFMPNMAFEAFQFFWKQLQNVNVQWLIESVHTISNSYIFIADEVKTVTEAFKIFHAINSVGLPLCELECVKTHTFLAAHDIGFKRETPNIGIRQALTKKTEKMWTEVQPIVDKNGLDAVEGRILETVCCIQSGKTTLQTLAIDRRFYHEIEKRYLGDEHAFNVTVAVVECSVKVWALIKDPSKLPGAHVELARLFECFKACGYARELLPPYAPLLCALFYGFRDKPRQRLVAAVKRLAIALERRLFWMVLVRSLGLPKLEGTKGRYKSIPRTAESLFWYYEQAHKLLTADIFESSLEAFLGKLPILSSNPCSPDSKEVMDEDDYDNFWRNVPHDAEFFTKWPGRDYLLTEHINSAGGGNERLSVEVLTNEHIMPKNPIKATTGWGFSEEEHARNLHRLGNLTMLTGKKNSSANDKSRQKKSAAYADVEVAAIKHLGVRLKKPWTAAEITRRGIEIATFGRQRWEWNTHSAVVLGDHPAPPKKQKTDWPTTFDE